MHQAQVPYNNNALVAHPWVRDIHPEYDLGVFGEVFTHDTYHLRDMERAGYKVEHMVDVGGHIGSCSMLVKSLWYNAHVVAIEPDADNLDLLRANLDGFSNIDIEKDVIAAAMRYDGACVLTRGDGASGGGFVIDESRIDEVNTNRAKGAIYEIVGKVKTVTLEQVIESRGLPQIDLLKLDCEGSEFDLMANASPAALAKVRAVCGEYHGSIHNLMELFSERAPHLAHRYWSMGTPSDLGTFWLFQEDQAWARAIFTHSA